MSDSGYFDLQVNGYAGVDFNSDHLNGESLHRACARLRDDGVSGILATIITDDLDRMCARLARIVAIREEIDLVRDVIEGIHIEGPFISPEPGYVGAHPPAAVQPASLQAMNRLLEAAGGYTRVVTLAPEQDPGCNVIRHLAETNIRVAAGHCNPDLEQLRAAIYNGLTLFTHLGNGCPMQLHRHDNIIQRVLHLAEKLWITFIADGAHVPYPALANYLKCAGTDRCIVVSDAIAAAGMGPGRYHLGEQEVEVGEDGVVWAADRTHFVGAATTLPEVDERLEQELRLDAATRHALTSANPRKALREQP